MLMAAYSIAAFPVTGESSSARQSRAAMQWEAPVQRFTEELGLAYQRHPDVQPYEEEAPSWQRLALLGLTALTLAALIARRRLSQL
jgi:hypothetical protein